MFNLKGTKLSGFQVINEANTITTQESNFIKHNRVLIFKIEKMYLNKKK